MKIAIVGAGISGLTAWYLLRRKHDVTVYEAADWIGGHTHTVDVADGAGKLPVDTGFIVFNERTYPNFIKLLAALGVESQKSDMSFSVRCEASGLEYNGTSLDTLFAQRRNLVRPRFLGMVRDILRFNRDATQFARNGARSISLGEFIERKGYGRAFVDDYIVPMGAAIWSAEPQRMLEFPFVTFARFFDNHGFLTVDDRPQWHVVKNGSRTYVDRIVAGHEEKIHARSPVERVRRCADRVEVALAGGGVATFDQVILAVHSDQALRMLDEPSPAERAILGAIPYQKNAVTLHRDASILPRAKKAWAAWNYHKDGGAAIGVTYWMNKLMSLPARDTWCVTLNRDERIANAAVEQRFVYEHPVYTEAAIAAQARQDDIQGVNRTFFAGAWLGYGFHEDGVKSGLAVARRFGEDLP
jgi:uncharacterized protein